MRTETPEARLTLVIWFPGEVASGPEGADACGSAPLHIECESQETLSEHSGARNMFLIGHHQEGMRDSDLGGLRGGWLRWTGGSGYL
jgi:hypothetical protein